MGRGQGSPLAGDDDNILWSSVFHQLFNLAKNHREQHRDRKAETDLESEAGPALPHINPVTSGQLSVPVILFPRL